MRGRDLKVTLESFELQQAASVGVARQVDSIRRRLQDRYGFDSDKLSPWHVHIEGACGELAVSKALNRFWPGSVGTFKAPDLPGRLQVRTRSGIGGREDLIVRAGDANEDIFVLVVGQAPEFTIAGWMPAADAKQEKWKQTHGNRPPAFFVPRAQLYEFPIFTGAEMAGDDFTTKPLTLEKL